MKIQLYCTQCVEEKTEAGATLEEAFDWVEFKELSDDNAYDARCPKNHLIRVVLQNARYELLFDRASLALIDGYHREAIATYACALERFFEHYVRVVFHHFQPNTETDKERRIAFMDRVWGAFDTCWKLAEKQSERQFGMFLAAHLLLHGSHPPFRKQEFEQRMKERNEIVHAGKLVERSDALAFGRWVGKLICTLVRPLEEKCAEACDTEVFRHIRDANSRLPPRETKSRYGASTFGAVSLVSRMGYPSNDGRDFEEMVSEFGRSNIWVRPSERYTIQALADELNVTPGEIFQHLRPLFDMPSDGDGDAQDGSDDK